MLMEAGLDEVAGGVAEGMVGEAEAPGAPVFEEAGVVGGVDEGEGEFAGKARVVGELDGAGSAPGEGLEELELAVPPPPSMARRVVVPLGGVFFVDGAPAEGAEVVVDQVEPLVGDDEDAGRGEVALGLPELDAGRVEEGHAVGVVVRFEGHGRQEVERPVVVVDEGDRAAAAGVASETLFGRSQFLGDGDDGVHEAQGRVAAVGREGHIKSAVEVKGEPVELETDRRRRQRRQFLGGRNQFGCRRVSDGRVQQLRFLQEHEEPQRRHHEYRRQLAGVVRRVRHAPAYVDQRPRRRGRLGPRDRREPRRRHPFTCQPRHRPALVGHPIR
mmetsp:Transcript_5816/g.18938  ORF Transcript_5816/g.18938 Transcript_5816/m.18938 type:complete len:329 (-) Transcript_5816:1979-2965(-)